MRHHFILLTAALHLLHLSQSFSGNLKSLSPSFSPTQFLQPNVTQLLTATSSKHVFPTRACQRRFPTSKRGHLHQITQKPIKILSHLQLKTSYTCWDQCLYQVQALWLVLRCKALWLIGTFGCCIPAASMAVQGKDISVPRRHQLHI